MPPRKQPTGNDERPDGDDEVPSERREDRERGEESREGRDRGEGYRGDRDRDRDRDEDDERGEDHDRDDERARPRRDGREHVVHERIVAKRLEGGAPATPEAYARALEQWNQLPGSVMRPPTDVNPPSQEPNEPPDEGASHLLSDDAGGEEPQP